MNAKLKSIYISLYVTLLFIATIHIVYSLYNEGIGTYWSGLAIAVLPALLFFVRLFLLDVPRTSNNLSFLILCGVIGTAVAWSLSEGGSSFQYTLLYGGGLGIAGLLLYVFWYSKLERLDTGLISPGKKLPDFELQSIDGSLVNSSEFLKNPSLLMFYRGNWCPLCMAQIKEIAGQYKTLQASGIDVFMISPQSHKNTQRLASKFEVPFKFMVDEGNRAARILGIDAPDGTPKGLELLGYESDTVLPTVILTDASGNILFADLTDNYRVRPEPETFIEVFKQYGIGTS